MRLHRFLEGAKSSEKPLHDENPRLTIYVADQSIWSRLAILTMSIPYCGLSLKCPLARAAASAAAYRGWNLHSSAQWIGLRETGHQTGVRTGCVWAMSARDIAASFAPSLRRPRAA